MVIDRGQRSAKKPVKQGRGEDPPEPTKINASTRFDFAGKNLTAYGGLLPVATLLEKLQFLSRCRYRGFEGMQRWVGLGVIADNIIQIGRCLALQRA